MIFYKGLVVATLSRHDVNELYEVRAALESLACTGFARNGTDVQIGGLRASLKFPRTFEASSATKDLLSVLISIQT